MMRRSRGIPLLVWATGAFCAALLSTPGIALAKDYCVNNPACVSGGGEEVTGASNGERLQTALTKAETGGPNRVLIGAGAYSRAGGFTYAGGTVTIQGAGEGTTTLTRNAVENGRVVTLDSSATIKAVGIEIPAAKFMYGLELGGGHAAQLLVTLAGVAENRRGVELKGGALAESKIEVSEGIAVEATGSAGGSISDTTVVGATGIEDFTAITVTRSGISASAMAIGNYQSKLVVEDSLIDLAGTSSGIGIYSQGDAAGKAEAIVHNVTLVNGGASSRGLWVFAKGAYESKAEVSDSIINGVAHPFAQQANETGSTTHVVTNYSSYETGGDTVLGEGGAGTPPLPSDNNPVATTPGFVKQVTGAQGFTEGDWRLSASSKLIDAGTPGVLTAGESTTDLAGNPRLVHGRRDVGAYEYQWRGPAVKASASNTTPAVGEAVHFSGSAEAVEPGDEVVSYQWTFDDGAVVPAGSASTHAFASPGTHTATLTAIDSRGVTGVAVITVTIPGPPGPTAPSHGAGAPTAPGVFELQMTPAVFRALGRGGSLGREPAASIVSFRLLAATKLTFAIEHGVTGHKHGHACIAKAKRPRHRNTCTLFVRMPGSFTFQGRAGQNNFGFTGRLGGRRLAHGRYKLVALVNNSSGALVVAARIGFRVH